MPLTGYGPYQARFVGGVLDGRVFEVPSVAPERFWAHGWRADAHSWPPASRDGAAQVWPSGVTDVYVCAPLEQGDGVCIDYTLKRTRSPRAS